MLFTLWAHVSYFLKDFSLYIILIIISTFLLCFSVNKIFNSKKSQKKKKILITVAFSIFMLILIYSAFEAYFRYLYDDSDGLGFLQVDKRWHQRHDVFNAYFFRDRNFDEDKKPGIIRIGVLGDSIAQGNGIKDIQNRFSNILEKKLKDAGKNVEVYNLGKSGEDTVGEVKHYDQMRKMKFDILVWEYFINDIQPEDSTGTPILLKNSARGRVVTFLSSKSFFFDYLYWRFSSRYNKTIQELRTADLDQYHNEPVLEAHKKRITDFIKSLKEDNTKVVVIFFPSIYLLAPDYPAKSQHYMMVDYFKQDKVDAEVDLLPNLKNEDPKKLVASPFDTHPNEIVHKLAADKLYDAILPLFDSKDLGYKPTSSKNR